MDKVQGNWETLSAMQLTEEMEGLDTQSKILLQRPEVLAVIRKETIEEYREYSRREIMEFIEMDSMTDMREVSPGRTNTQVRGDNPEFALLNEKRSYFDMFFRVKNPALSEGDVRVNLHVDLETQKSYRPGYPIEKRGVYYLARSLSSQLSLLTEQSDYGQLEKCYSIWICRDDIPKGERYSVSFFELVNTKNIGACKAEKKDYDLLKLVVIRLGDPVYNGEEGDEGFELLRFLNAVMYPHREDFMDTVSDYIDFSGNEELRKETKRMIGLGQSILEEGYEQGYGQGRSEGYDQGKSEGYGYGREEGIEALILDNLEEQVCEERILEKLKRRFDLSDEKARQYYGRFAGAGGRKP